MRWPGNPFRRLVPRTLVTRLILTIIGGLFGVALLGAAIMLVPGSGPPPDRQADLTTARIEAAMMVLNRLAGDQRAAAVSALSANGLSFELRDMPPRGYDTALRPLGPHGDRIATRLKAVGVASVSLGRIATKVTPGVMHVQLGDGTFVVVRRSMPGFGFEPAIRITMVGIIGAIGILALSIVAAQRTIRPLSRFADAAERFGTDVNADPMPEDGTAEIAKAAHAFNQMQARIQRYVNERIEMLAAISHDLKTPITRMKLRAEFIEDDHQRARALADLDEMHAMIAALIAFAKGETKEAATEVNLSELAQSVSEAAIDAGAISTCAVPGRVVSRCQPLAIRRALANLVQNAVRYGDRADISVVIETSTAPMIEIRVGDRGPGIPADLREEVFQPFRRLEASRSRDTGGSGLGLAIARQSARAHGGDIVFEDREGGGLVAVLSLPLTGPVPVGAREDPAPRATRAARSAEAASTCP